MVDDETLYERLGGEDAISAVVDRFYERVLDDDSLADYFEDTDMSALRDHQQAFLTHVTDGPTDYEGQSMRAAHAGLGITPEDFAAVAEHLDATLREFEVPDGPREDVMSAVADLEDEVLNR